MRHDTSATHKRACEIYAAKTAAPGTMPAEKMYEKMTRDSLNRFSHLFNTCHALAKHGGSFRDYVWQVKLDRKKGLDVGTGYDNDHAAQVFTHFIAKERRIRLLSEINEAPFLTLIVDGSTDSSSREGEMVYVRFCDKGSINVHFIGYVNVARANAVGILGALDTSMERYLNFIL